MARLRIGLTCAAGHFNHIGDLWEPVKDKDIDKLAERARIPTRCERFDVDGAIADRECGAVLDGLPHVEGREREENRLARVGGRNISAPMQSRPKARPKEGPLTPLEWKQRVFDQQRERPGGPALCAVTEESLSFAVDDAHHVLDKRLLRARGLHAVVWDPRNGMFIKTFIHLGQTNGLRRIPRDKIPDAAWAFAREIGEWAVQRLEADYPPSSTTSDHQSRTMNKGAAQ